MRVEQRRDWPGAGAPPARVVAGAIAMFILLAAVYFGSIGIRASRTAEITGDEPFYLLTTQSLIEDGDLDLAKQYLRRSYRSFFDHPSGLWKQSVANEDGELLSPHNAGLSVFLAPGFAAGGLKGAQVQLLLTAALAFVLTFVLVARITGAAGASWLATGAVGLTSTAFIYSTEVYPETTAALALVSSLLLVTGPRRSGVMRAFAVAALLTTMAWLGVKYVPLALAVAGYFMWHGTPGGRMTLALAGGASAAGYAWFHLATYGYLTPYSLNLVYAGENVTSLVDSHLEFDRIYRLWGLFVDERFGVGRWAPALLVVVPGAALVWRGATPAARLVVALVAAQVLIATFLAVTMMGWWFPGRTLMAVLPLMSLPVAAVVLRAGPLLRVVLAGLGVYSIAVTGALAWAGHAGEVVIAVDPFRLDAFFFQWASPLFPDYRTWDAGTWLLTGGWVAAGLVSSWTAWAGGAGYALARWRRRLSGPLQAALFRSSYAAAPIGGPAGGS